MAKRDADRTREIVRNLAYKGHGQPNPTVRERARRLLEELPADEVTDALRRELEWNVSPPTLASVSPDLGDPDGGIQIQLHGTSLVNVLSVTVGGVPCTNVVVVSSTLVTAYTPALPAGVYAVAVTTLYGTAALVAAFESWYPTQIAGPSQVRVYDSMKGTTVAAGVLAAWADQGAGAQNLAQAVAINRPALVNDRFSGYPTGREALDCDGVTQASYEALPARLPLTLGKSAFWVSKHTSQKNGYFAGFGVPLAIVDDTNAATYQSGPGFNAGVLALSNYSNIAAAWQHLEWGAGFNDGTARAYGVTHDAATGDAHAYVNGASVGGVLNSDLDVVHAKWDAIGAGNGPLGTAFDGELACAVVMEAPMGAPDIAKTMKWSYGKFVQGQADFVLATAAAAWPQMDGAAMLAPTTVPFIYILGGWTPFPGSFPGPSQVTNQIWRAPTANVAAWTEIAAFDAAPPTTGPTARWTPRHTAGWLVHTHAGTEYLYTIGSDIFNGGGLGTSDVWRAEVLPTGDLGPWVRLTDAAPWGPRVLHMVASFAGKLYVMGGQTDANNAATALDDVWQSSDGGATWVQLANAPWAARGMSYDPVVLGGKLWLVGGGAYDAVPGNRQFHNDVWSFDGATWTQVLADGLAPWTPRQYVNVVVLEGALTVVDGFDNTLANVSDLWRSFDGVTWHKRTITPWAASHANGCCVPPSLGLLVRGPGNGTFASGTSTVYTVGSTP